MVYCFVIATHDVGMDCCLEHINVPFTTSDQADEEEYIFDASLLKGYCSPIVEVSKLSLNNLTHEKLVIWLATMEQRLIEYTKYQSEKVCL